MARLVLCGTERIRALPPGASQLKATLGNYPSYFLTSPFARVCRHPGGNIWRYQRYDREQRQRPRATGDAQGRHVQLLLWREAWT